MDGMTLGGQRFKYTNNDNNHQSRMKDNGDKDNHRRPKQVILALHGWLDNCRSFYYLAPHLVDRLQGTAEVVALDLPGHGWSSHKSPDGPPMVLSEALYYVKEAIDKLGWNKSISSDASAAAIATGDVDTDRGDAHADEDETKLTLLGHSMGGGISMAYAGVFPDQVDKLIMLDVYGPLPGQADKTCGVIKSHIEARQHGIRPHRVYPSIERAIQARRLTASKAPGKQSLSLEAATEMVGRATEPVQIVGDDGVAGDIGVQFRHDTRLVWPSIQYLMPEQVDSLTRSVECPTCIIAGDHGWPFKQDRIETALQLLEPEHHVLKGSHHLHADPKSRDAVVDIVYNFLTEEKRNYVV
jgi:pimeloyl-ACP methyl ester carboxylesterase